MTSPSHITLNGEPHAIEPGLSVEALLKSLGLEGKPVVVELNEVAIFPRNFPETPVNPGDRVEIVTLAAGG